MPKKKYDFCGWVTKNDLRCSDGRTIRRNAFKDDDGRTVPLVWQHQHDSPDNVLGHAILENREDGVYGYGYFNDTYPARQAKELVAHGDIFAMSIYANQLKQQNGDVLHGSIKEVSLVLAGANPGALIDFPMLEHGEESLTEATIYANIGLDDTDDDEISHADEKPEPEKEKPMADNKKRTIQDVLDDMTDEQRTVVEYLVAQALDKNSKKKAMPETATAAHADERTVQDVLDEMSEEQLKVTEYLVSKALEEADAKGGQDDTEDDEEETEMKHNVFEAQNDMEVAEPVLSHADQSAIIKMAREDHMSLRKATDIYMQEHFSSMSHSESSAGTATYGVDDIEWLFPEARNLNNPPEFIDRDQGWVKVVMQGTHHSPFSRIKSMFADITADDARALGFMKGNVKKDEVFTLLRRSTDPQTVYKRQKIDRDDTIDITDFDVVGWIRGEMRGKLDEEIARAILIGDGRLSSSEDKISEDHIRSVFRDEDLFTIHKVLTPVEGEDQAKTLIKTIVRSWKDYKGSGNCIMFTTEDCLSDLLLLEDDIGHFLYPSVDVLARTMRVNRIVTCPLMDATTTTRTVSGKTYKPLAIILNLNDYNVGADKGGAVSMFDQFDIDYNQQKYLIETRCSGALIRPYSAISIEVEVTE